MTDNRVLVNMKVNDLFKDLDNTKNRFFADPKNKQLADSVLGEVWTTAAANHLLFALGSTVREQDKRKEILMSIVDMLERMFPEQPEESHNTNHDRLCEQGLHPSKEEVEDFKDFLKENKSAIAVDVPDDVADL